MLLLLAILEGFKVVKNISNLKKIRAKSFNYTKRKLFLVKVVMSLFLCTF